MFKVLSVLLIGSLAGVVALAMASMPAPVAWGSKAPTMIEASDAVVGKIDCLSGHATGCARLKLVCEVSGNVDPALSDAAGFVYRACR